MFNVQFNKASNDSVNVATTTTEILAANSRRLYALIVNDSDTDIYLSLSEAAVANKGLRLNAYGGAYEINYTNPFRGQINGIHGGAGNKVVTVIEAA